MNQIPNIEEKELWDSTGHKLTPDEVKVVERMQSETHNTREWGKEFDKQISGYLEEGTPKETEDLIKTFIHQQLQKARQDWLREEIVKLEGVKRDFIARWEHPDSELALEHTVKSETLYHLQTIIDRYHSELDQEVSK